MAGPHHMRGGPPSDERSEAAHQLADIAKLPEVCVRKLPSLSLQNILCDRAASLQEALWRLYGLVERTYLRQLMTAHQVPLLLGVIRGCSLANRALPRVQITDLAPRHFSLGGSWTGSPGTAASSFIDMVRA